MVVEVVPMTDEQLAKYLGIADWPEWQKAVDKIEPSKRAVYERMASLEMEITLWQQGLGPKPRGVILTLAKAKKHLRRASSRITTSK